MPKSSSPQFNILFPTLIFILITSPSISLTKAIIGTPYIPNEKIAIGLLVGYLCIEFKKNILNIFLNYKKYIVITVLLSFFIIARDLTYPLYFNIKNYNLLVLMFSVPAYFYYFSTINKDTLWKVLNYTVMLHLSIALFQYIAVCFLKVKLAMIFHNHPYQENYYFHTRVPGLFMESSQFASFMALYIILKIKEFGKKVYKDPIFILSLIACITNNALTAYIILSVYFFWNFKYRITALLLILFFGSIDYYFLDIFSSWYLPLIDKVYRSFIFTEENKVFARFSESYEIIRNLLQSSKTFLLGGTKVAIVSADLISYYFYYLGTIGLSLYLSFLAISLFGVPYSLIAIYICLCITNAQITSPVNLVYLLLFQTRKIAKNKE